MSTATFVDINDPAFTDKPQDLKQLTKRQAIRIAALGDEKRSWRVEGCGQMRARVCPNNHASIECRYCETRFCEGCAPRRAKRYVDKFLPLLRVWATGKHGHFERRFTRVAYCEIRLPLASADLRTFAHTLRKRIIGALEEHGAIVGIHWANTMGYENGCVLARTLFVYDKNTHTSHAWWEALWPEAKVKVQLCTIAHLPYLFEHHLMPPFLPRTADERADLEIMFRGIRMINGGMLHTDLPPGHFDDPDDTRENEIVEESETPSTNSPPSEHSPGLKYGCHCPKCGQKFTHVTGFMSEFKLREVIAQRNPADFYRIPPDSVH